MKLKHLILLAIPNHLFNYRFYGSIIAYQLYQINHKLDYLKDKDDLKEHQQ